MKREKLISEIRHRIRGETWNRVDNQIWSEVHNYVWVQTEKKLEPVVQGSIWSQILHFPQSRVRLQVQDYEM